MILVQLICLYMLGNIATTNYSKYYSFEININQTYENTICFLDTESRMQLAWFCFLITLSRHGISSAFRQLIDS